MYLVIAFRVVSNDFFFSTSPFLDFLFFPSASLVGILSDRGYDDFIRLLYLYTHCVESTLVREIPEESNPISIPSWCLFD